MSSKEEKLCCLSCGNTNLETDYEKDRFCPECNTYNIVTESERQRWLAIKGTLQLFTGNENQAPAVVIPRHLNKMGWIVAEVVNSETTFFPNLANLVPYDEKLFKKLKNEHKLNYHLKCAESLKKELEKNNG